MAKYYSMCLSMDTWVIAIFWLVMDNALMNIEVQLTFQTRDAANSVLLKLVSLWAKKVRKAV